MPHNTTISELEIPTAVAHQENYEPPLFQDHQLIGDGRYRLLRNAAICSGKYAVIYQGMDLESAASTKVAIKTFIEPTDFIRRLVTRELSAHQDFNNRPGIVDATDMGIVHEGPVPQRYLATRLADGNFLKLGVNLRGARRVKSSIDMASQVLPALATLHNEGFVHRDIKPQNILGYKHREGTEWVITDFGISGAIPTKLGELALTDPFSPWLIDDDSTMHSSDVIGSPGFIAPELIESPSNVSPKADIFGFGVTMFEGSTGELPYSFRTFQEYVNTVTKHPPMHMRSLSRNIPIGLSALTMDCLEPNPDNRPTAEQLVEEIAAL